MAFLTLFLGLITGVHPVELTVVDPDVVKIELRLDGRTVGVLNGPPWALSADFGEDLAPHELVAAAFDAEGRQVGSARQWINLPRARAEVELVLEGDPQGRVESARLVWSSVDVAKPETARVFLDGVELEGIEAKGFALPAYDVSTPHLLQAEVQLGDTMARDQAVVGGGPGSAISRQLTAVPVYLEEGAKLPDAGEMQGWIEARGKPVRVVAVERSGADVLMVQDLAWYLQRRLKGLRNEWLEARITSRRRPTGLKSRDVFRLVFPVPQTAGEAAIRSLQFPMSPNLWTGQLIETHAQGATDRQTADAIPQGLMVGIPVNGERKLDTSNQHLTDAVAVGALAAAQGQRARVLLLIAGSDEKDRSRYTPEQVRSYLAHLNVPLRIWSPEPEIVDSGWGEVESIATRQRLERSIRDLRDFLDRQVVVWVEGPHLPQELRLGAAAAGRLRLVTEVGPPPPAPGEDADLDPGLRVAKVQEASGEGGEETGQQAVSAEAAAAPDVVAPISFEETVEVNVVNVDVVVTGKDGERVRNLTREDFRLYEDGEPVEITHFQAPPPSAAAAEEETTASLEAVPERPTSLIVYVDLVRLSNQQKSRSLEALRNAFAAERDSVRVMIVVDDGSIDIPLTFTQDGDSIRAAIAELGQRKPRANLDQRRDVLQEMAEVREAIRVAHSQQDEESKRAALTTALDRRRVAEGMLPLIAGERKREVTELVGNVKRLALGLGGVEGRRAILYLGNRVNLSPGEEIYNEAAHLMADYSFLAQQITNTTEDSRQTQLQSEGSRLRLHTDFERMIRETSAVGVTFYTLTPPNVEDGDLSWRHSAGPAGRPASARAEAIKAAACVMAGETGGLCQAGGTDMERLLEATFDDFEARYSLAFTPGREPDGEFHKLELEVDRPDLELRYREGYLDRPREDAVKDRLIAALTFGEEYDGLGMRLAMEAAQPSDGEGMFLIPFEVRLPAQRLALVPLPGVDKRQARARLLITTMDGKGRTTGIQEYPISFEVSEARLATGQPLVYAHKVRLTLPAGEQTLAVGLWDDAGRVGSFTRRRLEVGQQ